MGKVTWSRKAAKAVNDHKQKLKVVSRVCKDPSKPPKAVPVLSEDAREFLNSFDEKERKVYLYSEDQSVLRVWDPDN